MQPVSSGSETILLVEDDDMVRNLAKEALDTFGYHVVVASNGEEALEILGASQAPFALLLTDVVMPRMGGPQLAERVRETHPDLKILFMSGYTNEMVLVDGAASATNFIAKPFTPDRLNAKIRELLESP